MALVFWGHAQALQNHVAHDKYHQGCRAVQTARHMYTFYLQRSNIIWRGNIYETPSYTPLLIPWLHLTADNHLAGQEIPRFMKPKGTLVHKLGLILSHLNEVHMNLILILFYLCLHPQAASSLQIFLIRILHAFLSLHMHVTCATHPILLLHKS
jgi:hypothetical protein